MRVMRKRPPGAVTGGFFFARANGPLYEADKGEDYFGAEFARCERDQCSDTGG